MTKFSPVSWCLAYRLVYGVDEFINLFYLFYCTENMRPEEAAAFIRAKMSHGQFRRAINQALGIEESCRRCNLRGDERPQGLYYFWQRKRGIFKYPQWEP